MKTTVMKLKLYNDDYLKDGMNMPEMNLTLMDKRLKMQEYNDDDDCE